MDKNIQSWDNSANSSYSNLDFLVDGRNIRNLLSDKTFLVRDSKRKSYSIYFAIENNILEIENNHSFLNEPESFFSISKNSSYLKNGSKSNNNDHYIYDIKSNWNNNFYSCIESYLSSQICIDSYILDDSVKYNDSDFNSSFFGKVSNSGESKSTSIITSTNDPNASYLESSNDFEDEGTNDFEDEDEGTNDFEDEDEDEGTNDFEDEDEEEGTNDLEDEEEEEEEGMHKYKHLWTRCECEDCLELLYKKFLKSNLNICEHCGYHLKMSSSDRIELLIDPDTWNPMDEYMFSVDPIEWDSEEEPYKNRLDSYQKKTGLMEAIQTGTGQLNGIPLAIGIMEFQFMGGSMGSVVGEKITRLIEYATNQRLPLILVCASGGARMQEGSASLMQMAKISSALYDYQINQKLFYVPILTSPTTGGVTASFGMLGDIIIAEPNAYIAFAGKRVIEQTLKTEVPEGSQSAEFLFEKGLFDSIVPRNLLKAVLTELFQLHGFVPLTQNEK
uniref:Acetyl-coenzyme A carboxylase carboxyl transferase subunit beta n=1 Tax=Astragalus pectinatus TaxID=668558 RepID=A0A8K1N3A9_9FABA|nr:acetyl-CoA carboxylase carboxyltransferase beta subunit [Astragalus pectinatus]UCS40972.1 acetyl-CoA carboxylase carboxyltransferase beta subunit [Astragalus pectinatus]